MSKIKQEVSFYQSCNLIYEEIQSKLLVVIHHTGMTAVKWDIIIPNYKEIYSISPMTAPRNYLKSRNHGMHKLQI